MRCVVIALLGFCLPAPTSAVVGRAQVAGRLAVSSGADPAEVTVGDRFRSVIRVDAPPGTVVEFPEHLGVTETYQSVDRVSILPGDDDDPHIAVYPLVAWRTGTPAGPIVPVHIRLPSGEEQVLRVTLPLPIVRSVLPEDTVGIEPRGARTILEARGSYAFWLLMGLLAAWALALWYWKRGRRHAPGVPNGVRDPRSLVIAELEALRSERLIEDRQWKTFFSRLSAVVRRYVETLSPWWTSDLTTGELMRELRFEGMPLEQAARLEGLLCQADLVKFSRVEPDADQAISAWQEARDLVEELSQSPRPELAGRDGSR